MKRLYRSQEHCVIAGICGGLGDYFDTDPVLVRVLALVLLFSAGIGIFAYLVAWIIIPLQNEK